MQAARLRVAGLFLVLGVGAAAPPGAAAASDATTIVMENMMFAPAEAVVRTGHRVVWINKDLFAHTVTSQNKAFDSGNVEAGASWSYVPHSAGQYTYVCALHPTMHATLRVVP